MKNMNLINTYCHRKIELINGGEKKNATISKMYILRRIAQKLRKITQKLKNLFFPYECLL